MSPTEDQLRSALSDGEGSGPDPDAIIGAALRIRRERRDLRRKVAGAAFGILVVAGVSIGIAKSGGDSGSASTASGGSLRTEYSDPQLAAPAAGAASPSSSDANANGGIGGGNAIGGVASLAPGSPDFNGASANPCPSTPVRYTPSDDAINGGPSGRGPLVSKPVSSLVFCLFAPGLTADGSRLLSDQAAQAFVDTADASTDGPTSLLCIENRHLEILPFASDGTALTPLSVTGTCHQVLITNGTAVRYESDSFIDSVIGAIATSPSGMMSGSPPR